MIGEGPEQLKVAFAGLMHPGKDCLHDAKPGLTPDASSRDPFSGAHVAVGACGGLERAHYGRPDGDDALPSDFA